MTITAQHIKELRERTGAGISDVKKALEESNGDMATAFAAIERKMGRAAMKKASRETGSGVVDAYIHSNCRLGVLLEVFCETDFVARNEAFRAFVHDLTLHITASAPLYLSMEAVPREIVQTERNRIEEEVASMNKPAALEMQIVDGKVKAFFGERCLLSQRFVKDQDKTVEVVLNEAIGRFGENIKIGRFARFDV